MEGCKKVRDTVREDRFTLVEMLTVTMVIAVLLAILLPVMSSARERGQRAQCTNNLREIGIATRHYLDDNKMWVPGPNKLVLDYMEPYVGHDQRIFDDPAHPLGPESWVKDPAKPKKARRFEYGANNYDYDQKASGEDLYYHGVRGNGTVPVYFPTILSVSNTIHMTDADPDKSPHDIGGVQSGSLDWPLTSHAEKRHDGFYIALFLDGHTEILDGDIPNHEQWGVSKKIERKSVPTR
jgi:type II secretory pathway pseudopilin PulG